MAGLHGAEYAKKRRYYKMFEPIVQAFGPEAVKIFKPKLFNKMLAKRLIAGGIAGAAPGSLVAALS